MNGNDYTLKIVKVNQEQAYDPAGKLVDVIRVEFMLGQHGPFVKRFAAADFDQNAARLELNTFAQAIQALGN
jgi:hypothetical protein